tara:strand:- start:1886 stop:2032 length:147 start_codon:yes stop_codon:yes gene_type:complete
MYECKFTTIGTSYSFSYYDLPTDNEEDIIKILTEEGYEVSEVYDIKTQ